MIYSKMYIFLFSELLDLVCPIIPSITLSFVLLGATFSGSFLFRTEKLTPVWTDAHSDHGHEWDQSF